MSCLNPLSTLRLESLSSLAWPAHRIQQHWHGTNTDSGPPRSSSRHPHVRTVQATTDWRLSESRRFLSVIKAPQDCPSLAPPLPQEERAGARDGFASGTSLN